MASSGCRAAARLALLLAGIAAAPACSQRAVEPGATATTAPAASGQAFTDPGVVLPEGSGRELLLRRCLGCHDLGGLELFKGFYTREDWRRLVETMAAHGAAVDAADIEVLADYLALNFGPL